MDDAGNVGGLIDEFGLRRRSLRAVPSPYPTLSIAACELGESADIPPGKLTLDTVVQGPMLTDVKLSSRTARLRHGQEIHIRSISVKAYVLGLES